MLSVALLVLLAGAAGPAPPQAVGDKAHSDSIDPIRCSNPLQVLQMFIAESIAPL